MSSSMRRLNRPENANDKEFYLECKAAFLSLYNDIEDKIESKKALNSLLQQSGRNPTRSVLDKYWPAKTEELTFTDFVEICKQEHVTTADDLMKAFRKIDTNGDGYISLEELYKIMNSKGENMTKDEVRRIINEVDENQDGKLNYGEFTNMIMKTTEESKKFCIKVMEKKERKKNKAEHARSMELQADSNHTELIANYQAQIVSEELGSQVSIRSNKSENHESRFGSRHSLKQNEGQNQDTATDLPSLSDAKISAPASASRLNKGDNQDLNVVLWSKQKGRRGSNASLSSIPADDILVSKYTENQGSKLSLSSKERVGQGSKALLRSNQEGNLGSMVSLHSKHGDMGSQLSLKSNANRVELDIYGSEKLVQDAADFDTGADSARSVQTALDYDDDDSDIVSTGRPTPRIDLQLPKNGTPRALTKEGRSDDNELHEHKSANKIEKQQDKLNVAKDGKGNAHKIFVDRDALASTGQKVKHSNEMSQKEIFEESANTGNRDNKPKYANNKAMVMNDNEQIMKENAISSIPSKAKTFEIVDSIFDTSARPDKKPDEELEVMKNTSLRSNVIDEIFQSGKDAKAVELARVTKDTDTSSMFFNTFSKDVEETPKAPPRRDKQFVSELKMIESKAEKNVSELTARSNNNGFGSHSSLRTGDKELSVPVPSPRKAVSPNVFADDVPKPSPRVKQDTQGKTQVSNNKDKLPDARALKDWQHFTSKGCFFYEEDEIVTHVYRLQLAEDSSVYMAACPIQEPSCLNLPGSEPVDTALFVFDSRGKLVACTEQRDTKGQYGVRCDLKAGEYQILPYTTGCRFKQRSEKYQDNIKESKLVKTVDNKIAITSTFRRALEDIFDLCDLDNNGTMSRDEFNWFNLRTSGEELGEDEWEVVEERTQLDNGEITKKGFIELNEMEAEDANGDVEDLWITLTSMGMNKALIMDEACPYCVDIYVEEAGKRKTKTNVKVIGIESLEKKEFVSEICQYHIEKAGEPVKIRNMKDLYMYTYRNNFRATIIIDNKSRSNVNLEADCSKSKNVDTNRPSLNYDLEIGPQESAIAHHLLPHSELSDWSVYCTETIHR